MRMELWFRAFFKRRSLETVERSNKLDSRG